MKIAFFSDIHANLPALEALFEDLDKTKPDAVYCLGDLVGYNVWANEVVDEIRKRGIPTIMGNHDEAMSLPAEANDMSNKAITRRLLTENNRKYLISLPRHLKLEFGQGAQAFCMLLVHGSPKGISDYLVEDYPSSEILDLMDANHTQLVLCGHTHIPYHRVIPTENEYKHVINIGSVGKPKDGDPRICYTLLTIDESLSKHEPKSIRVEFKRVNYDIEKAVSAIRKSDFPDEFADRLITAK